MHFVRLLLLLAMTCTLLAGCMGDDDSNEEAATATLTVAASPTAEPTATNLPVTPTATTEPTATATATTQPIASPTSSPTPAASPTSDTPTATPESDEPELVTLNVLQQGFSEVQSFNEVAFGFIVENPDTTNAVINAGYSVTAFQGGEALETESGQLDYILPGARVGVGGSVFIPEGRDADSIVIEITPGEVAAPEIDPGFVVINVAYFPGTTFPSATGIVSTTYERPLQDFEVFAIGYDEAGNIIGGGYSFVSFVHANSSTGVEVALSSADEPARVELYPVVTSLTIFALSELSSRNAEPLVVVADGFGNSTFQNELGWGFIVENPNPSLAAETTAYQATAYAADGRVLGVYSSFISLLLPGERLGLGGSFYLPEGTEAARLEFEVLGRYFRETEQRAGFLTPIDVTFIDDRFTPRVTGSIQNSLSRELTDIEVYALAYNAAGQIIGGGFTFIDRIEAEGQVDTEVSIAVGEIPASVELFATIGSLADIE